MQLGVFADQRDGHMAAGGLDAGDHLRPGGQLRLAARKLQLPAHDAGQPLLLQQQRHLIEGGGRGVRNDAVWLHVAEQGDLAADLLGHGLVCAADEDIRLDADGQQLLDRVLRGLALELARAGDLHDHGHMDEQHILLSLLSGYLPDGLEERLRLDIADGAADLGDKHVGLPVVHLVDAGFDLVGDVRDDLHGAAEISALALTAQDAPVDLARRHGAARGQALVREALIVAEVKVGLRAVIGDEDLAVLIRAHGAGVDVQVRVEFLVLHAQPALLEESSERCGADALAKTRDNAAGNEDIFHRCASI